MIRTLKLMVCALALCVTLSAQSLNGAGATFPNPIYQKWFTEYSAAHPAYRSTTSRSVPARASAR